MQFRIFVTHTRQTVSSRDHTAHATLRRLLFKLGRVPVYSFICLHVFSFINRQEQRGCHGRVHQPGGGIEEQVWILMSHDDWSGKMMDGLSALAETTTSLSSSNCCEMPSNPKIVSSVTPVNA